MNLSIPARPRSHPATLVCAIAVIIACILAGPFRTDALPLPARSLFWTALIGLNTVKWWAWLRFIPGWAATTPRFWIWLALGVVVLNALLPFEIGFLFRAIGRGPVLAWGHLFVPAIVISGIVAVVVMVLRTQPGPVAAPLTQAPAIPAPLAPTSPPAPSGLALRAGLPDLHGLEAIVAEDHYLRLHLADGRRPLVLYRFGDALLELAGRNGLQVHRGAWVVADAVTMAARDSRRWRLILADGTTLPVSERHLPAVRARGWLGARR